MEDYVRAFVDKYVKGVPGTVIEDLSARYPEIIFKTRNEQTAE
jgi:hypothetical protein